MLTAKGDVDDKVEGLDHGELERLLGLRNCVGLLSEQYDARQNRMLGNFPQALTHMALVNTARLLSMPQDQAMHSSSKCVRPAAVTMP